MSPHKTASPLTSTFPSALAHHSHSSNPASPATTNESIYSQTQFSSSETTSLSSIEDAPPTIRALRPGIYVPTVTFFRADNEDLDLPTIAKHAVRLARAGVAGITTQGSNGEAVHLSHQERKQVTQTTRQALNDGGFHNVPIIVGCGAQSTRETIELCNEALTSGGDYALVLPPSYFKAMLNQDSLLDFFRDVADASQVPILIYNYPAASGGIDFTSDTISILAKHPNIVGCKLTCGNTGKLARIAAATAAATPTDPGSGFMCMGGSTDFTLQTLAVGGSGIIGGMANIAPKATVKIVELWAKGNLAEAQKLQAVVARGDWAAISGGIVGTKSALQTYFGYGGFGRKPLPKPSTKEDSAFASSFKELVDLEKTFD
ncbi:uncharacterized protein KY384_008594 [Bacidia gigantensis]|uniref:uncharacterized protein n=1 Tax=Bacidia gigantensis TaxID=2732470 RepID=UPI001D055663|nr:uncharacterized protein KY384_008594 [Bacidia gigantensis]KAG8527164.1 hypothetical protein KY384_008594 [Bacidia gigantensis]